MRSKKGRSFSEFTERLLTTGSVVAVVSLGAAAGAVVVVGGLIATVGELSASSGEQSFLNATWQVLQRTIDPGQLGNEPSWASRGFLLAVTLIGLLLVSTLISVVNSTLERRIETARRGRRRVKATNHVVVLGWNELGTKYAEELAEAYEDTSLLHVVVLAPQDPVELLRSIKDDLSERRAPRQRRGSPEWRKGSRSRSLARKPHQWLTVRRGDPTDIRDLLALARVADARSVIVVSPSGSDAESTQYVLSVLAALQVRGVQTRRSTPLPVVAPFSSTALATRLATRIDRLCVGLGPAGLHPIRLLPVTPEMVRTGIAAHVAPYRGLSAVYRDILNFDDSELYIVDVGVDGRTFGDVALNPGATVLGLVDGTKADLWPDWETAIDRKGVVVLAATESEARVALGAHGVPSPASPTRSGRPAPAFGQRFLIVGWNAGAEVLVRGIRQQVTEPEFLVLLDEDDISPSEGECEVRRRITGSIDDPLDDEHFVQQFDHALVLAHDQLSDSESDARVLADVLACRVQASDSNRGQPLTVVAEFRQRSIKHVAGAGARLADDLLVNDSLSASAAVQLSIKPELEPVLRQLLLGTAAQSCLFPVPESETAHLAGMTWQAVRRWLAEQTGELPVAIRSGGNDPVVIVNPDQHQVLRENDEVIVLSHLTTTSWSPAGR